MDTSFNEATGGVVVDPTTADDDEMEKARELLGIDADADSRMVEDAYWRLAKQFALRRRSDAFAGDKLDQLNWAYQTLTNYLLDRRRSERRRKRRLRWRHAVIAGLLAAIGGAGLVAGTTYREPITDLANRGTDRAQRGWDDTITWLQELRPQPTPTPGPQPPAPPASQ